MIDHRIGKIKVRRGTDSQRKLVTFEEGELVFSIDKQRLYIGNGTEKGGILVSNRNYTKNSVGEPPVAPVEAQHGDLIFDKSSKRTYITKYNGSTYELILLADANCASVLQNQLNDANNRLNLLIDCISPKKSPLPPPDPTKLSWYTQPSDVLINVGDTLTLPSSASGGAGLVYYSWKKVSSSSTIFTSKDLIITNAQTSDADTYYCIANNSTDSITSRNAVVTFVPPPDKPPDPAKLSWYKEPTNISIFLGDTFTLTSSAAGGVGGVSYSWKRLDKDPISSSVTNDRDLTITSSKIEDFTTYYCEASNSSGIIYSRNATVSFAKPTVPTTPSLKLTWTEEPFDTIVNLNDPVTFTAKADGSGTITYTWKRRDGNVINTSDSTSSNLSISNCSASDIATYYCTASNSSETIVSRDATLDLTTSDMYILGEDGTFVLSELSDFIIYEVGTSIAPVITTQPRSLVTTSLVSVRFTIAARGTPPLSYQWRIGGVDQTGETGTSYTISKPTKDINDITCKVTNLVGNVISNSVNLQMGIIPSIATQPTSQSVSIGSSATFTVIANGSGTLSYEWKKNGVAISGASGNSYTISSVANTDTGNYVCFISNTYGSITTNSVILSIN